MCLVYFTLCIMQKIEPNYSIYRANVKFVLKASTSHIIDVVLKETASFYRISVHDILSKSRKRKTVTARQFARLLLREYTDLTLASISLQTGGADHSTVIHSLETARSLIQLYGTHKNDFLKIKNNLSFI